MPLHQKQWQLKSSTTGKRPRDSNSDDRDKLLTLPIIFLDSNLLKSLSTHTGETMISCFKQEREGIKDSLKDTTGTNQLKLQNSTEILCLIFRFLPQQINILNTYWQTKCSLNNHSFEVLRHPTGCHRKNSLFLACHS